jgi:hypothetical protein
MSDLREPRTEAGRRLLTLYHEGHLTGIKAAILAIEAEAALADSRPEPHVHQHYEPGMKWDDKRGGYVHADSRPEPLYLSDKAIITDSDHDHNVETCSECRSLVGMGEDQD